MTNQLTDQELMVRGWSNAKLAHELEHTAEILKTPGLFRIARLEAVRRLRWPDVYDKRVEA